MRTAELTLSAALDATLEGMRLRTSPTSQHAYGCHARMWGSLWGERPLVEITREDLEQWVAQRRLSVKDSTIKHQLALLSNVFAWAQDDAPDLTNPVSRIRTRLKRSQRSRYLSAVEESRLQEVFAGIGKPEEFSLVRFAVLTGCRRLEQMMLQPGDLRPPLGGEKAGALTINRGKTGQRCIPLHPEAFDLACFWQRVATAEGSPWIFWPEEVSASAKKRCQHGMKWERVVWDRVCKDAKLPDLQWRDLRRTYATRLVEKGVPLLVIQRLLGHSNPNQTQVYARTDFGQLTEAVLALG